MASKKEEVVEIRPLDIKEVKIKIVGDTPLIVHAWSEKAKRMMLEAQMKTTWKRSSTLQQTFKSGFSSRRYFFTLIGHKLSF